MNAAGAGSSSQTAALRPTDKRRKTMRAIKAGLLGSMLGTALFAVAIAGPASAQDTIKIGALTNLEGPFAVPGLDGHRGVDLAVKLHNGMAGCKKIEILK